MSYVDAQLAFEQYFNTHWTVTPIFWNNIPFDPPRDVSGNATPYVALIVRENAAQEVTLGSENPWYRTTDVVMAQIFTLERTGTLLAGQYAERIRGIFKRILSVKAKTDISVIALDNSFNSLTTDFITVGFTKNLVFTASGASNVENRGFFTIVSVTQRKVVVSPSGLVNESAGSGFDFHAVKSINYRNSGLIRPRYAEIYMLGLVNGWYQTNVTIPYIRDTQI